ncbi:MAG: cyclase [Acidimicrobiia bacterium]
MPTVLAVNHNIADYDTWKAVFDEFNETDRGVLASRINRNVEDPNNITVVHVFENEETARAFVDNPELAAAMGRAGVTSAPRIELFEEVFSS